MNSLKIDNKAIVLSVDMITLMYSGECYILVYHSEIVAGVCSAYISYTPF